MSDPRLEARLAGARAKRIVELEAELAAAREREAKLREALRDVRTQATRKKRASSLKRYLVLDLDIIERKCDAALADGEEET